MLVDYSTVPTYITYFDFFIAYVEILVLAKPCSVKGTVQRLDYKGFRDLFRQFCGNFVESLCASRKREEKNAKLAYSRAVEQNWPLPTAPEITIHVSRKRI